MLNLADVFEFIVDRLYDRAFPEHDLVVQAHQRVLHVLLYFCYQMYVIHEEFLKEFLTDISPVSEEFAEERVCELPVLQWCPVVHVPWSERPLDNLALVVDDQM